MSAWMSKKSLEAKMLARPASITKQATMRADTRVRAAV